MGCDVNPSSLKRLDQRLQLQPWGVAPLAFSSASSPVRSLMMLQRLRRGAAQDFFGTGCFIQGAVCNQHKLPGLERRLVLQYAVLGDAQAVQAGPNSAQTAHQDRSFQCPNDPTDQRAGHQQRPQTGDPKECGAEQKSPQPTPEGAGLPPHFYPVARVVVADHMLIGVIVASNNRQFLHIETGLL